MADVAPQINDFVRYLLEHGFINQAGAELVEKRLQASPGDFRKDSTGLNKDLLKLLQSEHLIDDETYVQARAGYLNLPYMDLRKTQVSEEVKNLVPKDAREFYHISPFAMENGVLKVAITDPENLQALEALEFLGQKNNLQIQVFLVSPLSYEALTSKTEEQKNVVGQAIQEFSLSQAKTQAIQDSKGPQKIVDGTIEEAPIIKIVDVIIQNAFEQNASDIHIEPSEKEVRVRYRVDGILQTVLKLPRNVHSAIVSRIKILSNLKIDETRLPQDGRFHVETKNRSVDFRVSTLPLIYGEKVVMRLLDKTSAVPTIDQLGIRGRAKAWVLENIKKSHGIFLITGPTGSGKSTTLYALLSMINTSGVNIVTLEDPVEYFIEGANQSQVNADIGMTFAAGLRTILRQDPNVIMVGEIRDQETAELAVHAALTGHLVFSTLHTNNSVGAVPRLVNMGIEPFLLGASMNVVMAQRLVRKLCQHCRKQDTLPDMLKEEVLQDLKTVPADYLTTIDQNNLTVYKAGGCNECGNTGYKGRMGIYEVLPITPEISEMLLHQVPSYKVYEKAAEIGMISLKQDGVVKMLLGETTWEEILRVTSE